MIKDSKRNVLPSRSRLGIIADDLSGAIECAALCVREGHAASVFPSIHASLPVISDNISVVVVVTDSRHLTDVEAANEVQSASEWLRQLNVTNFYKKTDSAGRGQIAAELAAIASSDFVSFVCFIPTFEQLGRTVVDGDLLIDGIPVSETAFGSDPLSPVYTSSLFDMLHRQDAVPVYRSGDSVVETPCIVLFDGKTKEDVQRSVQYARRSGAEIAGPAGALEALIRELELSKSFYREEHHFGASLIVAGSCHPITIAQIDYAESVGAEIIYLRLGESFGKQGHQIDVDELTFRARKAKRNDRQVIFCCARCQENVDETMELGRMNGFSVKQISQRVTNVLIEISVQVSMALEEKTIGVCGGATSQALVRKLGVRRLDLLHEIEPGIGVSRADTGHQIITKNGAFGKVNAITNMHWFSNVH